MVAEVRAHTNPGTFIFITGQPVYTDGHECQIAGDGGAQWTDDKAKELAADPSINENMIYVGPFILDANSEISDSCHANTAGQDALGRQVVEKFGR